MEPAPWAAWKGWHLAGVGPESCSSSQHRWALQLASWGVSRENSVFAVSAHRHHLLLYPLSFTARCCEFGVVHLLAGERSLGYRGHHGHWQWSKQKVWEGAGEEPRWWRKDSLNPPNLCALLFTCCKKAASKKLLIYRGRGSTDFSLLWIMWVLLFIAGGYNRLTLRIGIRRFLKSNIKCFTYGLSNWTVESVKAPDPKAVICRDKWSKVIYSWWRLTRTYIVPT